MNKANITRHIAALCNHGGGYLVFGFQDDFSVAPDRPASLDAYNHDAFNAIIKRYLLPTFECHVLKVESSAGQEYPACGAAVRIIAAIEDPEVIGNQWDGLLLTLIYLRQCAKMVSQHEPFTE